MENVLSERYGAVSICHFCFRHYRAAIRVVIRRRQEGTTAMALSVHLVLMKADDMKYNGTQNGK